MTTIAADPTALRTFGAAAAVDLDVVAHRLDDAMAAADGMPAHASMPSTPGLLEDVQRAVGTLVGSIAITAFVADEAERLDRRFSDAHLLVAIVQSGGGWSGTTRPMDLLTSQDGPAAVARVWAIMPPALQATLARRHPDVVGGLDGIGLATRDRANRRRIATEVAELDARIAALPPGAIADTPIPSRGGPRRPIPPPVKRRRDQLAGLLEADLVIDVDTTGDGRAVVAWGNPTTADTVATFVPGMSNSLATFHLVADDAHDLHVALVEQSLATGLDPDDVATIGWLGYDAPSGFGWGVLEAASDNRAVAEQGRLVDWDTTLTVHNPEVAHAVVAHSYGTVLAAQALQGDSDHGHLGAERIVLLGSPGPGGGIDDLADLDLPPDVPVFTASARDDWARWLPVLGPDPATFDGVEPIPLGPDNHGHADYLDRGTLGAANVARAVLGVALVTDR